MKLILTTAAAVLFALPAVAQQCQPRADILALLAEQYGETRQAVGMTAGGELMELFGSTETGSWTLTTTNAQGVTCARADGFNFEALSEALPPAGIDG